MTKSNFPSFQQSVFNISVDYLQNLDYLVDTGKPMHPGGGGGGGYLTKFNTGRLHLLVQPHTQGVHDDHSDALILVTGSQALLKGYCHEDFPFLGQFCA